MDIIVTLFKVNGEDMLKRIAEYHGLFLMNEASVENMASFACVTSLRDLTIDGNMGSDSNAKSLGSITFKGSVGDNCRIESKGTITFNNDVGNNVSIYCDKAPIFEKPELVGSNVTINGKLYNPEKTLLYILNKYEALFGSNPNKLRRSIPADEVWRFFIDGDLQKSDSWLGFEKRESGYMRAMVNAFDLIFDPTSKLSNKFIKNLHYLATLNVKNLNYDTTETKGSRGQFRQEISERCNYRLCAAVTTLDGLKEIGDKMDKQDHLSDPTYNGIIVHPKKGETLSIEETKKIYEDTAIDLVNKIFASFDKKDNKHIFKWESFLREKDGFDKKMHQFILDYQKAIGELTSPLEKLTSIVTFIRDCEQLHPFCDANCRTFCMLLLNYLLITNGFPLAIQYDPNRFDAYSIKELTQEVIHGMMRTFELLEKKCLFEVTTSNILRNASYHEREYFSRVAECENQNRYDPPLLIKRRAAIYLVNSFFIQSNNAKYQTPLPSALSVPIELRKMPEEKDFAPNLRIHF